METMLYFAYGANMQRGDMLRRCPGAVYVGRARLAHHTFRINTHGLATVAPALHELVHGVVWQINSVHAQALDAYEGLGYGLYRRAQGTVWLEQTGQRLPVMYYVAANNEPGYPRVDYLNEIIAAAERNGLHGMYVQRLRGWLEAAPERFFRFTHPS